MQKVIHVRLTRSREIVCLKLRIVNRALHCSGICDSIIPSREIIDMEEKVMSATKVLKIMTANVKRKYTKRVVTKKKVGRPKKSK